MTNKFDNAKHLVYGSISVMQNQTDDLLFDKVRPSTAKLVLNTVSTSSLCDKNNRLTHKTICQDLMRFDRTELTMPISKLDERLLKTLMEATTPRVQDSVLNTLIPPDQNLNLYYTTKKVVDIIKFMLYNDYMDLNIISDKEEKIMTAQVKETVKRDESGMRIEGTANIKWWWYRGQDVEFPKEKDYTVYFMYKNGVVVLNGVNEKNFHKQTEDLLVKKDSKNIWRDRSNISYLEGVLGYVVQKMLSAEYQVAYNKTKAEMDNRYQEFKRDTIKAHGLEGHKKAEKAFAMAWEKEKSNGLVDVYYEVANLADLLLND